MSKTEAKKIRIFKTAAYTFTAVLLIISLVHYHIAEKEEEQKETKKSIMGPYKEPTKEGFIMLYNKKEIEVLTQNRHAPPVFGEVLVYGDMNQSTITAIGIHNYNYNYLLYIMSAIAGLLVAFYFFKEWKITKGGIIDA